MEKPMSIKSTSETSGTSRAANSNFDAAPIPPSARGASDNVDQLHIPPNAQEPSCFDCIWEILDEWCTEIGECLTGLFNLCATAFGARAPGMTMAQAQLGLMAQHQRRADVIQAFMGKWGPSNWSDKPWNPEIQGKQLLQELDETFGKEKAESIKFGVYCYNSDFMFSIARVADPNIHSKDDVTRDKKIQAVDTFLKNNPPAENSPFEKFFDLIRYEYRRCNDWTNTIASL
jgi:hypothetical protein